MNELSNPYTGVKYTDEQFAIIKRWLALGCADKLVLAKFNKLYEANDCVIFKAATGTGKGVIIAPHVMDLENFKKGTKSNRVVITEPRTANVGTATYVAKVYSGKYVNFGHKYKNMLTEETLLSFVTDGLLVKFFYNDPELKKYKTIIIDEAHERNASIDQIMAFCRITKKKIVILSATIDVHYFSKYMSDGGLKTGFMEVGGVTHPVEVIYTETKDDYLSQAIDIISKIIESGKEGDILVFLASASELKKGCTRVAQKNWGVACYELHRGSRGEVEDKVKDPVAYKADLINGKVPSRKIVFSTNIAESGVTVEGLKFVIDSGRRYESLFIAEEEMDELKNRFISKAESDQRKGRVGRTSPGTCYRLFSEDDFAKNFTDYKEPEILVQDLSDLTISILNGAYSNGDMAKVNFLYDNMPDPPTERQREFAIKKLRKLEFLTPELMLTKLGRNVATTGVDIENAIVLIRARSYGIYRKVCRIMCMFSIDENLDKWFKQPREGSPEEPKFNYQMKKWASPKGEIFVMRSIFDKYSETPEKERFQWCKDNFLDAGKLAQALNEYYKMTSREAKVIPLYEKPNITDVDELISQCFVAGYKGNLGEYENGTYKIDRPIGFVKLDKPIYLSKLSKKIMFTSISKINGKVSISGILNL